MLRRQQAAGAGCEDAQMNSYPSGRMLAAVMRDVSRTAMVSGRAASGGDLWIPTTEAGRSLLSDTAAPLRPVVLTKHSHTQASPTAPQKRVNHAHAADGTRACSERAWCESRS